MADTPQKPEAPAQNSGGTGAKKPPRGRPFVKGQSGNPGGRPPVPVELKALANEVSAAGLEAIKRMFLRPDLTPEQAVLLLEKVEDRFGRLAGDKAAEIGLQRARAFTDRLNSEHLSTEQRGKLVDAEIAREAADPKQG